MRTRMRERFAVIAMASSILALIATSASAEMLYGIAYNGAQASILGWDSAAPTAFLSSANVSTSVLGIDAPPSSSRVYILRSNGQISNIDPLTGGGGGIIGAIPTAGFSFGFEYNPIASSSARFDILSDLNQNLGAVSTGNSINRPNLAYAIGDINAASDPNIVGIAYTNNVVGATSAILYGIDSGLDILVTIDALTGELDTVGPLGVDVKADVGFDISGASGIAYAAMVRTTSSQSELFTIDLATGAASSAGPIGGGIVVTGLTVQVPEPATLFLAAAQLAMTLAASRRRR